MARSKIALIALTALAACDPVRFVVENDTNAPVEMRHSFYRIGATCHADEYRDGELTIAAKTNAAFACTAEEIGHIELSQNGRSCRLERSDLMALHEELKASHCFADGGFSTKR